GEALIAFVRNRGPQVAVRELILSTASIAQLVCEDLRIPLVEIAGSDAATVNRLLWKLGFSLMQFDDSLPRFKARLADFNTTILTAEPIETEDCREHVRSVGVNLFVSVEEFLDSLIAYNVWLL